MKLRPFAITPLPGATLATIGRKAANLAGLTLQNAVIPTGLALNAQQAQEYCETENFPLLAWFTGEMGSRLAVRSSPQESMPGLLETVLDVANEPEAVLEALRTVVASWQSERAIEYRETYEIDQTFSMGILLQDYIAPDYAGTLFTRCPQYGDGPVLEAVAGANGSGLVGGTAKPVTLPTTVAQRVLALGTELEKHFAAPLDIEWAYQGEQLYLLQVRPLRYLNPAAAALIAADMQREGLLTADQAQALVHRRDSKAPWWLAVNSYGECAQGLGAVSGAVSGKIAIRSGFGPGAIYVASHTGVAEVSNMLKCDGILTNLGGQTCHAALLAMQAGKPAVVGADFTFYAQDPEWIELSDGTQLREGSYITIDGATGHVYYERQPIIDVRQRELDPFGVKK